MKLFSSLLLATLLVFLAIPPERSSAQGIGTSLLNPLRSFGGTITSVIPCSGGMIHITIVPSGLFPISYVWTPVTITKLSGPPIAVGQQLIGLADLPFVCFIGGGLFSSPVPLFGFRIMYMGSSVPGALPQIPVLSV